MLITFTLLLFKSWHISMHICHFPPLGDPPPLPPLVQLLLSHLSRFQHDLILLSPMRVLNCGTNNTTHHPDLQQTGENVNTVLMVWPVSTEASSSGVEFSDALVLNLWIASLFTSWQDLLGPQEWVRQCWNRMVIRMLICRKTGHTNSDHRASKIIFRSLGSNFSGMSLVFLFITTSQLAPILIILSCWHFPRHSYHGSCPKWGNKGIISLMQKF